MLMFTYLERIPVASIVKKFCFLFPTFLCRNFLAKVTHFVTGGGDCCRRTVWQRGSVVRTSVFGWQTSWSMPNLWL